MSKELTERWRNGVLPIGHYYVKRKNGRVFIDNTILQFDETPITKLAWSDKTEEVLSPVPTYDQFVELTEKANQFPQMVKKVEKLEKQLREANDVIKFYSDAHQLTEEEKQMTGEKYHLVYGLKANDYIEKWGVK